MRPLHCLIPILCSAIVLVSCFPTGLKRAEDIYCEGRKEIRFQDNGNHSLDLLYTGCGGVLIHSEGASILVDPFYSYAGILQHLQKLKTDKEQTDSVFHRIENVGSGIEDIHHVLLAHSHYDHMMDLPYVLNTFLKNQNPLVIGSSSARNILAGMPLSPYRFQKPVFRNGKTFDAIQLAPGIRLFVICSEHAPHARALGIPIQGMTGPVCQKGIKGFDTNHYASSFLRWKEGTNYSFLLEFRHSDRAKPFRIFIQSSSCAPPNGIPTFLPPGDSVDLALVGVASSQLVVDYPRELLTHLRPRKVILIHWEDFFRAYEKEPKIVRGTSFKTFLTRYQSVMGSDYAHRTSMPRPGTLYRIVY